MFSRFHSSQQSHMKHFVFIFLWFCLCFFSSIYCCCSYFPFFPLFYQQEIHWNWFCRFFRFWCLQMKWRSSYVCWMRWLQWRWKDGEALAVHIIHVSYFDVIYILQSLCGNDSYFIDKCSYVLLFRVRISRYGGEAIKEREETFMSLTFKENFHVEAIFCNLLSSSNPRDFHRGTFTLHTRRYLELNAWITL